MAEEPRTALGSARERFADGLFDRGREMLELCHAVEAAPSDVQLHEQLRKRLQSLNASAQMFQAEELFEAIKSAIAGLDAARDARRALSPTEIELVLRLCGKLGADDDTAALDGSVRHLDSESPVAHSRTERWSSPPSGGQAPEIGGDRSIAITQSVAGSLPAAEVLAVLVLAGAEIERLVRAALPDEQCELTSTGEADTALVVIDQVAPDLVLVEASFLLQGGDTLVRGLRGGRVAGVRAVVALVAEAQSDVEALLARARVDAVLRLPLPRVGLLERLLRMSGRGLRASLGLSALGSGTVDDIARTVGEEVRRGIADSLRLGRGERIELHDKSELLAAAWSAVTRIRAHLTQEAHGRIRFDEAPYPGGPAALALTDHAAAGQSAGVSDSFKGRRILIADDDPAVLWFFAGLLREAGAIAIEARDGKQALEQARRKAPDLVISDILMPEIDGFALCRELKRDLSLCHVPVILLSWKEDFLQRMRELDAGANGYLRKEAGSLQILTTVAEALRPRAELVTLLAGGGELQGRMDGVGVPALLATVASVLPDARITLRDAWNLFEVDIRGGSTLAVTRTASDGSFARGQVALRQLLGVDVGRFAVVPASGAVRGSFAEPLDKLLSDGITQLSAVLDAISDNRLLRVQRVGFDDEILGALLSATPTAMADLAARLREGASLKELVLSGAYAPSELEQHMRELARRGAVIGVWSADGEDLVEAARRMRAENPGQLLHGGPRSGPSSPLPESSSEAEVEWVRPRREVVMSDPTATREGASPASMPAPPARASRAPLAATPSQPPAAFSVQSALLRAQREQMNAGAPAPAARWGAPAQGGRLRLGFTLVALVFAGYLGWRTLQSRGSEPGPKRPATAAEPRKRLARIAERRGPTAAARPLASSKPAVDGEHAVPARAHVLPFIDQSRGVAVGQDEGLLVVEYDGKDEPPPRVHVGGRDLGLAPTATALPGGRHELLLKRGTQTSFRYVVIHPGETRIVDIGAP
jgi:CheY-like chemotaxis protein